MQTTAEIAGMFVAHQLWLLAAGAPATPMLVYETVDGTRQVTQLLADDAREAVDYGHQWLEENPEHAARAVLIADGFLELEGQQVDALIFEGRTYVEPTGAFTGAVPYRPKERQGGFAIYRLKLMVEGDDAPATEPLGAAFFRGLERHEQGALVWDEYFVDVE